MDVFDQPPRTVDPTLLSDRTIALRDNQETPLPQEGQARQRRLERLQTEMALIQAFVADCDRITYGIRGLELELEFPDARAMVLAHLDEMKKKAQRKEHEVRNELLFLRNQK
jgi:hypothetical protein